MDPAYDRPQLGDHTELRAFEFRGGNDYAILANRRDLIFYRLDLHEADVVRRLDGSRTLQEIVVDNLTGSGELELSGLADLVAQLRAGGFLSRPFTDLYHSLELALAPPPSWGGRLRRFARSLSIEWSDAERLVRFLYTKGVKWCFTRSAQVVAVPLALFGFVAFVALYRSDEFELVGDAPAAEAALLIGMSYLLTFIHELGHASVLVHYGRRVKSAGFMIYFGSPAFFVESSDGLMLDRRRRIAQSFAGPYAEMVVAGSVSLVAWAYPEAAVSPTLFKFAVLNYFVIFENLVPFLELDGYWIFSEIIQAPDLRHQSLAFVRYDLWHKLWRRERLTRQEVGFALYGVLGVGFTLFFVLTAIYFWRELFGELISSLWDGGAASRVLLIVLGAVLAGPAIRGAIGFVRAVLREARARVAALRFRFETGWRVEAARLIDGVPVVGDLPVDVLNELAGRFRLRPLAAGQPVVRQGQRADAFYVVRRGVLQVIEEDRHTGNERTLRTLGRGEVFGELGLAEVAPRRATVRAVEPSQVFELDKAAFDRFLADRVTLPDFAPTVQALEELRAMACFAHLELDELGELAAAGEWVSFRPGETIVRRGERGDAFYAISAGQVHVVERGKVTETLVPGSYFGEIALLLDVPRTATVRAFTPVRAFRVGRAGFNRLLRRSFRKGTLNPHIALERAWQH